SIATLLLVVQKIVRLMAWFRHWEFWPAWLFYLPLAPWYLWLSLRYRSLTIWTAANPGIPAGGVVGGSKFDILSQLPQNIAMPTILIPQGEHRDRLRVISSALATGWTFPLVLKPDAGQRGAGVRRVDNVTDVEKHLLANPDSVIVQPYHP